MTGSSRLTPGQSGFQVKWIVTLGCLQQVLIHRSSAAMLRISEISRYGVTRSRSRSTAKIASTALPEARSIPTGALSRRWE